VGVAVLATAGVAAAANGGFTPQNAHSPNAVGIKHSYLLILVLTAIIFVVVESMLVIFIWRFRSNGRPRTVDGAQVHGHTRLEVIWTVIPVVILAVIASFVFYKLPGIANAPAASNPLRITVEAHQYYWQFDYPNGARSINDLHVPAHQVVLLTVRSYDVVHSWWIPQLGGKIQAIPGKTNSTWFEADKTGVFQGQCSEFCGPYHEAMRASVIATTPADYHAFVSRRATAELGQAEFEDVCAVCHGNLGQGGYGPNISSNPLLTQPAGLAALLRTGRGKMPPVGISWTEEQMRQLQQYVQKHIYKGATTSGG
jgi:cytochrome c oxidase subunit 2